MKKKIFFGLLMFLSFFYTVGVSAAPISVNVNSQSVYVGASVVVTVKTSDAMGKYSITSSNPSVLSGGASSEGFQSPNEQNTYTFRANAVGTATITFVPIDMALYSSGQDYTEKITVNVTVKNKPVVVLSSNNYLSSLGIEGVGISPEFNKDISEYAVEMEPGTTKVNIVGSVEDGTASVEGFGEKEVVEGANRFEIIVIAQNGTSRNYVLNVNVKEFNPIVANINGNSYNVVRKRSELMAPANYVETTVMMGEEEVPAYYSEITKYTLVGLKDEVGNIGYYIYHAEDSSYQSYQEYTFQRIVLYPMELKAIPEHYHSSIIVINDQEVTAYKIKESSPYALLYGMNVETGNINLYLYNSEENTLQIYYDEEIKLMEEENKLYGLIILCLGGVCLLLLLILIIVICKKRKNKDNSIQARHKKRKEKKQEEISVKEVSVS